MQPWVKIKPRNYSNIGVVKLYIKCTGKKRVILYDNDFRS